MDTPINGQDKGKVLHSDPASLLAAWQELNARHPHLHNPQAAAMLGVSEAALIASRLGSGAWALEPDVDRLLAPIANWGRTLVAVTNSAVVSLAFYEAPTISVEDGQWTLHGADGSLHVDRARVRHAYYFEDRDAHGNTRSFQLFDEHGGAVAKVFIFAKSRLHDVRNHVQKVSMPDQSRGQLPEFALRARPAASRAATVPAMGSQAEPTDPSHSAPSEGFVHLFTALPRLALPVEIAVSGGGARQVSRGPVTAVEQASGGLHVSETRMKLHMFPARLASVSVASDATGENGEVRFTAVDGGQLRVRPMASEPGWFAMLGRVEGSGV